MIFLRLAGFFRRFLKYVCPAFSAPGFRSGVLRTGDTLFVSIRTATFCLFSVPIPSSEFLNFRHSCPHRRCTNLIYHNIPKSRLKNLVHIFPFLLVRFRVPGEVPSCFLVLTLPSLSVSGLRLPKTRGFLLLSRTLLFFDVIAHSIKKGSSLPLTLINAVLYFPYLFFNFSVIFFKSRNSS